MIHEFEEEIPVETPLGKGDAIFIEFAKQDNYWTVILKDSRAFVTFTQNQIRAGRNYTKRRGISDNEMRKIIR